MPFKIAKDIPYLTCEQTLQTWMIFNCYIDYSPEKFLAIYNFLHLEYSSARRTLSTLARLLSSIDAPLFLAIYDIIYTREEPSPWEMIMHAIAYRHKVHSLVLRAYILLVEYDMFRELEVMEPLCVCALEDSEISDIQDVVQVLGCFSTFAIVQSRDIGIPIFTENERPYLAPLIWLAAMIVRYSRSNDLRDSLLVLGEHCDWLGEISMTFAQIWPKERKLLVYPSASRPKHEEKCENMWFWLPLERVENQVEQRGFDREMEREIREFQELYRKVVGIGVHEYVEEVGGSGSWSGRGNGDAVEWVHNWGRDKELFEEALSEFSVIWNGIQSQSIGETMGMRERIVGVDGVGEQEE